MIYMLSSTTVLWVDLLGQRRVIGATRRQVRRQPTTATSVDVDEESEHRRPVSYCRAIACLQSD